MGADLLIIAVVVLAVTLALVGWSFRTSPRAVAARRIRAQLAECTSVLADRPAGHDPIGAELTKLRSAWFDDELRSTPIEMIKAAGIGAAAHELLRRRGVACAADLPRVAELQIPSIGEKKRQLLLDAHIALCVELERTATQMPFEAWDERAGGALTRMKETLAAEALERSRDIDAARIRARELEERLRMLRNQ